MGVEKYIFSIFASQSQNFRKCSGLGLVSKKKSLSEIRIHKSPIAPDYVISKLFTLSGISKETSCNCIKFQKYIQ